MGKGSFLGPIRPQLTPSLMFDEQVHWNLYGLTILPENGFQLFKEAMGIVCSLNDLYNVSESGGSVYLEIFCISFLLIFCFSYSVTNFGQLTTTRTFNYHSKSQRRILKWMKCTYFLKIIHFEDLFSLAWINDWEVYV